MLVLACVAAAAHAAKLPSYLTPRCSRSLPTPALSACCEKLANQGVSSLAYGDKKLRIPSMRPLIVPHMSLSQGTQQIGLNLTWEPAEIWGLEDSRLYNMTMDWQNKKAVFDVVIPRFTLAGHYKSSGRVLLLPVNGEGPSNMTVYNLRVHYSYDWPIKKNPDGKEYVTITNSAISISGADGMKLDFQGMFNGDPLLGNQMNAFLNENWRELIREMGPGMAEATGQVTLLVMQGLTSHVPVSEMFDP